MRRSLFETLAVVGGVIALWAFGAVAVNFDVPIGSVSGRITEKDGRTPIPKARVWVGGWGYGLAQVSTWTDSDGRYLVRSLPVGKYGVRSVAPGFIEAQSIELRVEEGRELKNIDLELPVRLPDFSLYRSRATFAPDEKIRVSSSGYLPGRKIEFALYRMEVEALLAQSRDQGGRRRSFDTTGREPAMAWPEKLTYIHEDDGTFDAAVKIKPQEPGFYVLEAKAEGKTRQVWFFVTRLALITKSAPNEFLCYVVDMVDNKPAAGASVRILGHDLRSEIARGTAGEDGVWTGAPLTGNAGLVIASSGENIALCHGESPGGKEGLTAFLFTDRPVYRPGHTVYFKGIVRKPLEVGYALPESKTYWVVARNWEGEEFFRQTVQLSDMGSFDGQLTLPAKARPGDYSIALTPPRPDSGHIDSRDFDVQEYRKPEYKVEVQVPKRHYAGGETVTANVTASYFFGAPAAGAEVKYRVYSSSAEWWQWRQGDEELWRYDFAGWSESCTPGYGWEEEEGYHEGEAYGYGELNQEGTTTTDAQGNAVLRIETRPVMNDQSLTVEVDVTDASRKTISAQDSTTITQGEFALGLSTEGWLHKPRAPVKVEALAVDYEGKRVQGARIEWDAERVRWRRTKYTCVKIGGGFVSADQSGKASFDFTPDKAGSYRVRAQTRDAAGRRVGCVIGVWVQSEDPYFTAEYPYPSLEFVPDKKAYEVGETARVMINTDSPKSPMLVTVEGERLYSHRVETTPASSRVIEVPIREEHMPRVRVSACFVKDKSLIENSVWLEVSPKRFYLNVEVKTDRKRYHPGDLVNYRIKTTDLEGNPAPAEVTLGVVDEAVYAVKPDSTPKMRDEFYDLYRDRVRTESSLWEYYGAGQDKFADVKVRKYFPDTAFWAASVRTDSNGEADVGVRLPDNITAWRATARACTADTKVGEARHMILARKDLMVRISAPRFMTQRDVVTVAGIVHNYTEESRKVAVDFGVAGAKLQGAGRQHVTLEPDGSQRFDWRVEATVPGDAKLTLRALAGKMSDGMEIAVPVLAHGHPVSDGRTGEVPQDKPRTQMAFQLPEDAMPGTARLKVWMTPSLATLLLQSLDSLVNYPYGCIEQRLSSFVPAVAVSRVLEASGQPNPKLQKKLPQVIQRGLDAVCEMQNSDGGWGWYLDESNGWTTGHAVYALAVARSCGVNVPADCLDRGAAWLEKTLKPIDIYIPKSQDTGPLQWALREKAWVVHALALAGRAPKKDLDELFAARRYLNPYGYALLTLALHAAADPRAQVVGAELAAMRQETPATVHWVTETNDYSWLDSDTEGTAFCLLALLRTDPMNPMVGKIARWLVLDRKGGEWTSTKTTAAVLLAMAEYMARRESPNPQYIVTLSLNGKRLQTLDIAAMTPADTEKPVVFGPSALKHGRNLLRVERQGGMGALYYTALMSYSTGIEDVPAAVSGITVRREYEVLAPRQDPKRGLVYETRRMGGALRAGEIVRVRLMVTAPVHYRYVVLEDRLPSGFEVVESEGVAGAVAQAEAARRERLSVKQRAQQEWQTPWWHREVHDDRVAFFATNLYKGKYRQTYFLRAEMPGDLHGMPALMYPMYEPGISGNSSEVRVTVRP